MALAGALPDGATRAPSLAHMTGSASVGSVSQLEALLHEAEDVLIEKEAQLLETLLQQAHETVIALEAPARARRGDGAARLGEDHHSSIPTPAAEPLSSPDDPPHATEFAAPAAAPAAAPVAAPAAARRRASRDRPVNLPPLVQSGTLDEAMQQHSQQVVQADAAAMNEAARVAVAKAAGRPTRGTSIVAGVAPGPRIVTPRFVPHRARIESPSGSAPRGELGFRPKGSAAAHAYSFKRPWGGWAPTFDEDSAAKQVRVVHLRISPNWSQLAGRSAPSDGASDLVPSRVTQVRIRAAEPSLSEDNVEGRTPPVSAEPTAAAAAEAAMAAVAVATKAMTAAAAAAAAAWGVVDPGANDDASAAEAPPPPVRVQVTGSPLPGHVAAVRIAFHDDRQTSPPPALVGGEAGSQYIDNLSALIAAGRTDWASPASAAHGYESQPSSPSPIDRGEGLREAVYLSRTTSCGGFPGTLPTPRPSADVESPKGSTAIINAPPSPTAWWVHAAKTAQDTLGGCCVQVRSGKKPALRSPAPPQPPPPTTPASAFGGAGGWYGTGAVASAHAPGGRAAMSSSLHDGTPRRAKRSSMEDVGNGLDTHAGTPSRPTRNPFDDAFASAFGTPLIAGLMQRYQSILATSPLARRRP